MFSLLRHLFIPHHSNGHRPKILHHDSLFILILFFFTLSTFAITVRKTASSVLGIATNINVNDLISFTNQKRGEQGLPPLKMDEQLSKAAGEKAANMFAQNYWAHNAPDGTTPWVFFQHVGYNYVYAGENLAKDFNDSEGVVNAWMASPSHRENLLNAKYEDVGFAVLNGTLLGEETTLVVQEFGKRQGGANVAAAAVPASSTPTAIPQIVAQVSISPIPTKIPTQIPTAVPSVMPTVVPTRTIPILQDTTLVAGVRTAPLLDSASLTKRIAVITLLIIIASFVLDMIYIERKKLFRLVGHNSDHIFFLTGAILLILIIGGGIVL